MVESGGLENRYTARYLGFESLPLRIIVRGICLIIFTYVITGCGSSTKLRITEPLPNSSPKFGVTVAPANSDSLVGKYYSVDGLGMNVVLTLNVDSTYSADWHGCLGKYGDASGLWNISDTLLILTPANEDGAMTGYLRAFIVQRFEDVWILIRPEDFPDYQKRGVSRYVCYQKYDR